MEIIKTKIDIRKVLNSHKLKGRSIGFVPTMGALHAGHVSLVKKSNEINDITICSVFVNPTQFNKSNDFENYPSTIESDVQLLEDANCDILFLPSKEEMYSGGKEESFDYGNLGNVMEGAHRPGHFNGVALVISKFFNILNPNSAFFGQKDYQQLAIIKQLVIDKSFNVKVYSCSTFREKSGLAMSSRNNRLNKAELIEASIIYKSLQLAKKHILINTPKDSLLKEVDSLYNKSNLELEYIEIADPITLQSIKDFRNHKQLVICVAAFLGDVRLIDNIVVDI